jgi:ADP-ribose pyrophosphatase
MEQDKMSEKPRVLHEGEFLRLLRSGTWEYVQRTRSSGAVHVVAVTAAGELLLVEQYRVPVAARCIELPAGIMGDSAAHAGESAAASGMRELLEETGYRGSSAQLLCAGPNAAGLTTEFSNLVLIEGLTKVHAGGGVDGEDITVHAVPLPQVPDWLKAQQARGLLIEPRIYAGLYFLQQRKA